MSSVLHHQPSPRHQLGDSDTSASKPSAHPSNEYPPTGHEYIITCSLTGHIYVPRSKHLEGTCSNSPTVDVHHVYVYTYLATVFILIDYIRKR